MIAGSMTHREYRDELTRELDSRAWAFIRARRAAVNPKRRGVRKGTKMRAELAQRLRDTRNDFLSALRRMPECGPYVRGKFASEYLNRLVEEAAAKTREPELSPALFTDQELSESAHA